MKTVVSGIQPSGELHLGNYLGAIAQWFELKKKANCFFLIADYHSLTEPFDPKKKREQILELAASLLALGINPKNVFVQSHVTGHTELGWIFNCITPVSYLEHMTQFKDKSSQQAQINAGLFDYPVLQAADVLLYHGDAVPVGEDQLQHLELTRDITRWFNKKFGKTFDEPKPILTKSPRLMSLTDPKKKMSKSHGPASYIALSDEPNVIYKKLKGAVTATSGGDMSPGVKNLFTLLEHFGFKAEYKKFVTQEKNGSIRYSELKETLAQNIAEFFADFREMRKKLLRDPRKIEKILAGGAKRAQKVANETIKRVRQKVGLL